MNRAALRKAALAARMLAEALEELDEEETAARAKPLRRRPALRPPAADGNLEVTDLDQKRAAQVGAKWGLR